MSNYNILQLSYATPYNFYTSIQGSDNTFDNALNEALDDAYQKNASGFAFFPLQDDIETFERLMSKNE